MITLDPINFLPRDEHLNAITNVFQIILKDIKGNSSGLFDERYSRTHQPDIASFCNMRSWCLKAGLTATASTLS
jgi:hypothetical protein